MGQAVADRIKSLNDSGLLFDRIDVHAVVEPLSQLDTETALEILDSLQERIEKIHDPTNWIVEAAIAVPQDPLPATEDEAEEGLFEAAIAVPQDPLTATDEAEEGLLEAAMAVPQDPLTATDEAEEGLLEPSAKRPCHSNANYVAVGGQEVASDDASEAVGVEAGKHAGPEGLPREGGGDTAPLLAGVQFAGPQPRVVFPPQGPRVVMPRYKTELCRRFQIGLCMAGPLCNFAHGPLELRPCGGYARWVLPNVAASPLQHNVPVHPTVNLKIIPCSKFLQGCCEEGDACKYAHGDQQVRLARMQTAFNLGPVEEDLPDPKPGQELTMEQICNYKTQICRRFALGYCKLAGDCLLAHGKAELRMPWKAPEDDGHPVAADMGKAHLDRGV